MNDAIEVYVETIRTTPKPYHCPLPRKKMRVTHRAQRPGPVRVYSEQERLSYAAKTRRVMK